jgi:hypothetical protein
MWAKGASIITDMVQGEPLNTAHRYAGGRHRLCKLITRCQRGPEFNWVATCLVSLREWLDDVAGDDIALLAYLRTAEMGWDYAAELCRAEAVQVRKDDFEAWLTKLRKGGREAFKYVKGTVVNAPAPPRAWLVQGISADQIRVNEALHVWNGIWSLCPLPAPAACIELGECLPPITDKQLTAAARRFTWITGLGADGWHPRHVLLLPRNTRRMLCALLTCFDGLGHLPTGQRHITGVLLPKPAGGHRIIGLLGGLYRLWAQTRMHLVKDWARSTLPPYFYAEEKRGCEVAVREQLLCDAYARARGLAAASVLLDLSQVL